MEHTTSQFDTELQALRHGATTMGQMVERQFIRAVDAVRMEDLGLAAQVLADEADVNRMHVQIDLRCNRIIARRQPIAVDLREIIAILHINNDLERIGDEAKKIAFKARDLAGRTLPIDTAVIERMSAIASDMVRCAVEAFEKHDIGVSQTLAARDAEVDALRDTMISALVASMADDPKGVSTALALVFIVQSIERVGDHAKNIAEYVVTVVEGVDTRHTKSATARA
ncbi:MAG: phosphate signaling complex protein PhoU [Lautropia sp.]